MAGCPVALVAPRSQSAQQWSLRNRSFAVYIVESQR